MINIENLNFTSLAYRNIIFPLRKRKLCCKATTEENFKENLLSHLCNDIDTEKQNVLQTLNSSIKMKSKRQRETDRERQRYIKLERERQRKTERDRDI